MRYKIDISNALIIFHIQRGLNHINKILDNILYEVIS